MPECPLLQLDWWRLVADEAQMVAPFGATGEMLGRVSAKARWCVTGTPFSSSHELEDISDLLVVMEHGGFWHKMPWNWRIATPLKEFTADLATTLLQEPAAQGLAAQNEPTVAAHIAHTRREAKAAWLLLLATLRPLFWRNTKTVVAAEYQLPLCSWKTVHLNFQPGEQYYYDALKERCQRERQQLRRAEAGEMVEETVAGGGRKRRRSVVQLSAATTNAVMDLRLSCIHPQLTSEFRESYKSDMQVGAGGGMLAMDEILKRMVDKIGVDLQEMERGLASHVRQACMWNY